jgi:Ras-related protein Rab-11A
MEEVGNKCDREE